MELRRCWGLVVLLLAASLVVPTTILAAPPKVGGYIQDFSPSGRTARTKYTKFSIVSEVKYRGAGAPNRSGGGLYTYRFRCRDKGTTFYLVKVGQSTRSKVSRNTFVEQVLYHRGDLDPVATVAKWHWDGSGKTKSRHATVITCNLNE